MFYETYELYLERLEAERLEAERLEAERLEAERLEEERVAAEILAAEQRRLHYQTSGEWVLEEPEVKSSSLGLPSLAATNQQEEVNKPHTPPLESPLRPAWMPRIVLDPDWDLESHDPTPKERTPKNERGRPLKRYEVFYKTRIGGSFFFHFTEECIQKTQPTHPSVAVSPGLYGTAYKAERRTPQNLASWWYYMFSELLAARIEEDRFEHKIQSICLLVFWRLNNLSLRYLFLVETILNDLETTTLLYFFKYNFFRKSIIRKKLRHIRKYKLRALFHSDRFSRRELWIHTLNKFYVFPQTT